MNVFLSCSTLSGDSSTKTELPRQFYFYQNVTSILACCNPTQPSTHVLNARNPAQLPRRPLPNRHRFPFQINFNFLRLYQKAQPPPFCFMSFVGTLSWVHFPTAIKKKKLRPLKLRRAYSFLSFHGGKFQTYTKYTEGCA